PGMFVDLTVKTNYVIAAGGNNTRGILVRVYDALNGTPIWQDQSSPQAGFADFINAVTATDNAVYVVGVGGKDFEYSEFLVRGYNWRKGAVIFKERSERAPSRSAADIAVAGNFLTVVGTATSDTSPSNGDWIIRAYRIADLVPWRRTTD